MRVATVVALAAAAAVTTKAKTVDVTRQISGCCDDIDVSVGDTVKWTWGDGAPHNVAWTTNPSNYASSGSLETGSGTTHEQVMDAEGTFAVVCDAHASMNHKINVLKEGETSAPSSASRDAATFMSAAAAATMALFTLI